MLACTFTFKKLLLLLILATFSGSAVMAQNAAIPANRGGGPADAAGPAIPVPKKEDNGLFDHSSPYLDYGDFNMNEEENDDALYFQYGRFFGVSLGAGYEGATGNRGKLYEAALPRFDVRMHYWFNFNFAMDLGVWFANHQFTFKGVQNQVKLIGYGVHLKYYFDVRDASAALTFANPFLEVGAGAISKTMSNTQLGTPEMESTLSVDVGGGLEFPIVHKKTYFIIEALYHTQNFGDTIEVAYQSRVSDLSGGFFTLLGHFMFVW